MDIDRKLISVRDLTEADVPFVSQYWYHSPPGFIESLGVDLAKMGSEVDWVRGITQRIRSNSSLPVSKFSGLAILYDGKPIGIHSMNMIEEGDSGVFHAHIISPEFRRRGIGMFSYPLACKLFIERFGLKRVLFKTPAQNAGAIRVKEKLGIRCIGEEVVGFGIVRDGTLAKVFELTAPELDFILKRNLP